MCWPGFARWELRHYGLVVDRIAGPYRGQAEKTLQERLEFETVGLLTSNSALEDYFLKSIGLTYRSL